VVDWSGVELRSTPDDCARKGIIIVTLSYRLGRLGLFAHPALAREAPDDPQTKS
jgi:para-nitrobenzyl esterase